MASVLGLGAIAVVSYYGGWEWALVLSAALAILWTTKLAMTSVVATIAVSLIWLAMFHWSGDRRLFFPYSMQFALQMPYLLKERVTRPVLLGGGGIILLFLAIRIIQQATWHVLLVEFLVAMAILLLVVGMLRLSASDSNTRVAAGALASLLAFAGLAI